MECNYEGVDELLRELEQEAEHPVQRRAENERQREHEEKIVCGEASEALDRAIEIGSEPTAQAQLQTPPVTPIHFTLERLPEQNFTQNIVASQSIQAPGNNGGEIELQLLTPPVTPSARKSKKTSPRKSKNTSRNNGKSCPIPKKMGLAQLGRKLIGETDTNKQICPYCKKDTNTRNNNNPHRDLIDHIYALHFTHEIGSKLRKEKPFTCPLGGNGCEKGKDWGNFQSVMRHYSGTKHGVAMKLVLDYLAQKFEAELNQ